MKDKLKKRLQALTEKRDALKTKADASNDINELRSINDQMSQINDEITFINGEIRSIEETEKAAADPVTSNMRSQIPENAQIRGANIMASFKQNPTPTENRGSENVLESMEYRMAFKAYVQEGTPIPAEYRAGDAISTENTGAAIPLTIMNEVINTIRLRYGNLYSKVRKLSVKGGVEIPVGALKATFRWVNQSTTAPTEKAADIGKVQFSYHEAEIKVAQTFIAYITAIDAFETALAEAIAIEYMRAIDVSIVNGTGKGMPLGILNDPRVLEMGRTVSLTAAEFSNWTVWQKKVFAKQKLGYRGGEFIFNLATVDACLRTMSDSNNRPIFYEAAGLEVGDGDAERPRARFFGREVAIVEPDILPDFDTASSGDVVGIFWQPMEYGINENFAFTMYRYFDHNENQWIDKALTVVDGKAINPTGFILIKKAS